MTAWLGALFASLIGTEARAGNGYKDIAYFQEGTVATLSIVVEYKPDDTRSINVRFNRSPYASSLFFHREQWKTFSDQLERAQAGPDGAEQTFPDLDTPGGSLLRMSSVRHGGDISLTLIHQSGKGDSYPAIPFHLKPADLALLQKAVLYAARAETIVSAPSASGFARFRADLGTRFTAEQLQDFDIAIQELQLDATSRNLTVEAGVLAAIDRRTLPDAIVLGWRARKARLIREIPEAIRLVNQDTAEAARTAAADTPDSLAQRLASEKEALAKLRRDRDDTLRHLTELTDPIGRSD